MKLLKWALVAVVCGMLMGCGHGYEGEYTLTPSNEIGKMVADLAGMQKIVIGSDYIESQGKRTLFEKIFVRKSGDTNYLVFKDKNSEESFKIVDKNTLVQGTGLGEVTLKRIK